MICLKTSFHCIYAGARCMGQKAAFSRKGEVDEKEASFQAAGDQSGRKFGAKFYSTGSRASCFGNVRRPTSLLCSIHLAPSLLLPPALIDSFALGVGVQWAHCEVFMKEKYNNSQCSFDLLDGDNSATPPGISPPPLRNYISHGSLLPSYNGTPYTRRRHRFPPRIHE